MRTWLTAWAWGGQSAAEVARQAQAFVADGHRDPVIEQVARAAGRDVVNAERALRSILPLDQGPSTADITEGDVGLIIPPAVLFRWVRDNHPTHFQIHFGADPRGVQSWWEQLAATPDGRDFWSKHPFLRGRSPQELRYHIPLVMHDDAGPVSKYNSAYVRSFHSILGVGKELESRFLVCTYMKQAGCEDRSWPSIMRNFEDLAGDAGAGRWGGVLLFFSSDLEYACNELGLRHFNGVKLCCYCNADTADTPHNDFGSEARWRGTVFGNGQFMRHLRAPRHPAAAHPWFNMYTYRLDLLHILDHHGVSNTIFGNVLWAHIRGPSPVLPGTTQGERIGFLNEDIKAYYDLNAVANRLPPLRVSNIRPGDFPELSGSVVKAANTRSLAPYVLDLQRRATTTDPTDANKHMLKVVESVSEAYNILYSAGYFLTAAEAAALDRHLTRMGLHFQRLAFLSAGAGELAWQMRPKLHYSVAHLSGQAKLINPRFVQTYGSEGLVGKVCNIYKSSQYGPYHAGLQKKVLAKYRTGLVVAFAR